MTCDADRGVNIRNLDENCYHTYKDVNQIVKYGVMLFLFFLFGFFRHFTGHLATKTQRHKDCKDFSGTAGDVNMSLIFDAVGYWS